MRNYLLPVLFAGTLFLSASLLLAVEPLVGKLLLPKFGGAASVWGACLCFFQAALLIGYGYAHLATRWLGPKRQVLLHGVVLLAPLLVLPIGLAPGLAPPPDVGPAFAVVGFLLMTAGLPFLVVSASSPLLQRWFTETGHPSARDPYFLNAASNTGSMLALLSYPTLIEPNLALLRQSQCWSLGYLLLVALVGLCGLAVWREGNGAGAATSGSELAATGSLGAAKRVAGRRRRNEPAQRSHTGTRVRWVLLAFVPSSLVLGATNYLTTNIAPAPLMWVVPLALYLLTFILVFSRLPRWVHWTMVAAAPVAVISLAWLMYEKPNPLSPEQTIAAHLVTFFVAAMVCHGELAQSRPAPEFLTEYYWWIAVGGALGGMFNAFVAPLVFKTLLEYPLMLALSLTLAPPLPIKFADPWPRRLNRAAPLCFAAVAAGVCGYEFQLQEAAGEVLLRERNFFGVLSVRYVPEDQLVVLAHGDTNHGEQFRSPDPRVRRLPLTYFFPNGPIGQAFQSFQGPAAKRSVAVIGLGAGSLAAYADKEQSFTFYELDPAVPPIAEDPQFFTFVSDARQRGAEVNIVLGDARLSLQQAPDHTYDLIVLDAFSGDAIPVHLLTREAVELYLRKLADGGLLAMHITNGYLNLAPVVGDLAGSLELTGRVEDENQISRQDAEHGKAASTWVILGRRTADLGPLASDPRWRPLAGRQPPSVWTDDYSNVFSVFR